MQHQNTKYVQNLVFFLPVRP